jgi:hypothetical protein
MSERRHCGECVHYDFGAALLAGEKNIKCVALPPQTVLFFEPGKGPGYMTTHPIVRKEMLCCGMFKALVTNDGVDHA